MQWSSFPDASFVFITCVTADLDTYMLSIFGVLVLHQINIPAHLVKIPSKWVLYVTIAYN